MLEQYPLPAVTALILAGGQGRRLGGVDKGLILLDNQPMVQQIAGRLQPQCNTLLLSANRSHADYRALGFEPLNDLRPDYPGPLAGIEAGIQACGTRYLLICPCDSPAIPPDMGKTLWQSLAQAGAKACYAATPERSHYLNLLLDLNAPELESGLTAFLDSGGRAVRHWLNTFPTTTAMFNAERLVNLNQPEDFLKGKRKGPEGP